LWGNKIYRLSNNSFAGLGQLRHLDLSHNRLSNLTSSVLAPLTQLQHLDLSNNRFRTLSGDLLRHNRLLQVFKFEENLQRTLTEPDAEWLQTLELPQGLLSDLSQLSRVSLADSAVASLPRFLLRGSGKLAHLDLRGNRIKTVPKFFLQDAVQLKWLDLSVNSLDTLSTDMLSRLETPLLYFNLSSNLLGTLPPGNIYRTVQILDIRDNLLQTVSGDIVQQLNNNSQLQELFFFRGNVWNCLNKFTRDLMTLAASSKGVASDYLNGCSVN